MTEMFLSEFIDFNPTVRLPKDTIASFVPMDSVIPWHRDVVAAESKPYTGGTKFLDGDVLLARITPSLENGKTSIYRAAESARTEPAFGSTEFIVARGIEGISDTEYIYYLLRTDQIRSVAIASMTGSSGRQRVQLDTLESTLWDLPDLVEQQQIAATLGALDDKIESNRRAMTLAQDLGDALFEQVDSSHVKLEEIAEIVMGISPKGEFLNETGNGLPFYQGTRDFGFRFPTLRVWTTEPKRQANANDVLLSVRAPVGDLNRASQTCCIGRGIAAIRSVDFPSTLYYAMRGSTNVWEKFNAEGTVFGSVKKTDVHEALIKWPKCENLAPLEERLSVIDRRIASLERETQYLATLRDCLLPELMSGRASVRVMEVFG